MPASTLGLIVELLCFCVQHHQYRVKYYILRSETVSKVPPSLWCMQYTACVTYRRVLNRVQGLGSIRVQVKACVQRSLWHAFQMSEAAFLAPHPVSVPYCVVWELKTSNVR